MATATTKIFSQYLPVAVFFSSVRKKFSAQISFSNQSCLRNPITNLPPKRFSIIHLVAAISTHSSAQWLQSALQRVQAKAVPLSSDRKGEFARGKHWHSSVTASIPKLRDALNFWLHLFFQEKRWIKNAQRASHTNNLSLHFSSLRLLVSMLVTDASLEGRPTTA